MVVATLLANDSCRTNRANGIARIQRACGMPPPGSAKPTAVARLRRVSPVTSGSVPRNLAQAPWEEAATALDPPPDGLGSRLLVLAFAFGIRDASMTLALPAGARWLFAVFSSGWKQTELVVDRDRRAGERRDEQLIGGSLA